MSAINGKVWIMPVNAEPIGQVGDRLLYGDEHGIGTAEAIGTLTESQIAYLMDGEEDEP